MNQKLKFHPVEMKPIDYLSEMKIMRVKKKGRQRKYFSHQTGGFLS